MKKKRIKIIGVIVIIVIILAIIFINNDDPHNNTNTAGADDINTTITSNNISHANSLIIDNASNTTLSAVTAGTPKRNSPATTLLPTIQDIVNMEKTEIEAVKDDFMEATLEGKGNSIIYKFKYLIYTGNKDDMKPIYDQSIEELKRRYESMLSRLKESKINEPSVIVEYYDYMDNLVTSREFK